MKRGGINIMIASKKMKDRYYVQRLTEEIFLIRERMTTDGEPGPDDRIVRSFSVRHDAYIYADSLNNKQKEFDEHTGRQESEPYGKSEKS